MAVFTSGHRYAQPRLQILHAEIHWWVEDGHATVGTEYIGNNKKLQYSKSAMNCCQNIQAQ